MICECITLYKGAGRHRSVFIKILKEDFIVLLFDNNELTFDNIHRAYDAFLGIINCAGLLNVEPRVHASPYDVYNKFMARDCKLKHIVEWSDE